MKTGKVKKLILRFVLLSLIYSPIFNAKLEAGIKSDAAQDQFARSLVISGVTLVIGVLSILAYPTIRATFAKTKTQLKPPEKVTFQDVLGLDEVLKEVEEIVNFLKNPHKYHDLGAKIPRGILFEGPPGTGKTLLARALAYESGAYFMHKSGSEFINKYVGAGASNVRNLFDEAKAQTVISQKPVILFIDEIDALGSRKGLEDGGGDREYHQTINEILNQMDGFEKNENIIVIAATNNMSSLDPAILRPGRFDRKIHVPLPDKKGRKEILNYYIAKIELDDTLSSEAISKYFSQQTTGFSGAELENLINEAALLAARKDAFFVTLKYLNDAYDRILLGLERKSDRRLEELKWTAYHEAGHTTIALLKKHPISKVSIVSRDNTLGVLIKKEKYETFSEYTKEELLDLIKISQGGFIAEKLIFNSSTPGAASDHEHANNLAHEMVCRFGMGNGILEGATTKNIRSPEVRKQFDTAALKIIETCKKKTEILLEQNKDLLIELSEALLEKETLNEDEIYAISEKYGIEKPISQ